MKNNNIPTWLNNIKTQLSKIRIPSKIIFIVVGFLSTIWFLIRVIPKPSRATYPCMKAAAPFMSGFVIYLLTITGSFVAFKKAKANFIRTQYFAAGLFVLAGMVSGGLFLKNKISTARAKTQGVTNLTPNSPMGTGVGVNPGRVTWVWDPDATNENCTNDYGVQSDPDDDDGYFLPKNNDQKVIDYMMDEAVIDLASGSDIIDAWDKLFKNFNNRKNSSSIGYTSGEKVFIKINTTGASWLSNDDNLYFAPKSYQTWQWVHYGMSETSPQIILSTLRQLIDSVGVAQEDIIVADPLSRIWENMYIYLHDIYPDVIYGGREDFTSLGRTTLTPSSTTDITYSDGGSVMSDANTDHLYVEMRDADYLINLAALKGHVRAGITLCAKNHFGSHTRTSAGHLHPGLVAPDGSATRTSYGLYRVQVDIMGNEYLGGNTVLNVVDGLWGGPHDNRQPVKWRMAPFNTDWPSSIFVSQDQVALESVCFDFLRTEFDGSIDYSGDGYHLNPDGGTTYNFPNYGGVDDYLEQAADPSNWPASVTYAPSGVTLTSLGVHEHWNNSTDKEYSRNLGTGTGIYLEQILDLPTPDPTWYNYVEDTTTKPPDPASITNHLNNELSVYPVPASNELKVKLINNYTGNIVINIMDISGKKINKMYFSKEDATFEQALDISSLPDNMYIIKIEAGNNNISKKFYKID